MKATLLDVMGTDLTVVNAARVSFHKHHKEFQDNDEGLLNFLARHEHHLPFAHPHLMFHVKAPLFVARQLAKHQVGFVWSEVSRRYVDEEPEFYMPSEWRGKPTDKKQGSSDVVITELPHPSEGPGSEDLWGDVDNKWHPSIHIHLQLDSGKWRYNDLIKAGVAPELARLVLPLATYTEWIWTGSLLGFARVCRLRMQPDAQQETKEITEQIYGEIGPKFPKAWNALTLHYINKV